MDDDDSPVGLQVSGAEARLGVDSFSTLGLTIDF